MLDLGNPPHRLGLASCPFEVTSDLQNLAFVTLKSCSLGPLSGPCLFEEIAPDTFMNRWGLDNPGVETVVSGVLPNVLAHQPNVVLSAFISEPEEVTSFFTHVPYNQLKGIELNLSCPNRKMFSHFSTIFSLVRKVVGSNCPVGLKIGSFFPQEYLKDVAPDFVTFANTLPHFDEKFGLGGLSGSPLRDAVLKEASTVRKNVAGSLILCGGVKTAKDYIEYLDLGADYVALASHYLKDREVVFRILSEI